GGIEDGLGIFLLQRFQISLGLTASEVHGVGAIDRPHLQRVVFSGRHVARRIGGLGKRHFHGGDGPVVPHFGDDGMERRVAGRKRGDAKNYESDNDEHAAHGASVRFVWAGGTVSGWWAIRKLRRLGFRIAADSPANIFPPQCSGERIGRFQFSGGRSMWSTTNPSASI